MMKNTVSRRALLSTALFAGAIAATGLPTRLWAQANDTLRIAAVGSTVDSLDPHRTKGQTIDIIRYCNLFDGLTEFAPDGSVQLSLAEKIEPGADATEWTVTLRPGIQMHDGSTFTASDVLASVRRILDPENPTKGAGLIDFIDPAQIEVVDDLTLVFHLAAPYGPFADIWANRYLRMVPEGFDPARPVGTGAYKLSSFTPGRESVFDAFPAYFRGAPLIGTVVITSIADSAAQMNALRGGQIDVAYDMPMAEARVVDADPSLMLLRNPTNLSIPIFMRADQPPFDDPRVRKAFKLIVDREQMVKIALAGYGEIGNDMQSRGGIAGCGEAQVPQRVQDIAAAKALLAEAGYADGLEVEMATTAGTTGMVECCQVFAEQAKAAGVTVKVQNLEQSAFLSKYMQWTFGSDFLIGTFLPNARRSLLPDGTFNTAHWNNAEFNALFEQAVATSDLAARCEIMNKMREIEYEDGANIIWGFADTLNAVSARVQGLEPYPVDSAFLSLRKLSLA